MAKSPHSPEYEHLRTMLRDARKKKKITQAEIAERLGKPQSYVAKYEIGERRLDLIELLAVLEILDIKPAVFVSNLQRRIREAT